MALRLFPMDLGERSLVVALAGDGVDVDFTSQIYDIQLFMAFQDDSYS